MAALVWAFIVGLLLGSSHQSQEKSSPSGPTLELSPDQQQLQWLEAFGLNGAPTMQLGQAIPEYMRTLYQHLQQADQEEDDWYRQLTMASTRNVHTVLGIASNNDPEDATLDDSKVVSFTIRLDLTSEEVSQAELVFERHWAPTSHSFHAMDIRVAVCMPAAKCSPFTNFALAPHRVMKGQNYTFDIFDITVPILNWLAARESRTQEQVTFCQLYLKPFHKTHPFFNQNVQENILLVLYKNFPVGLNWPNHPPRVAGHPRHKRSQASQSSYPCQLQSWRVSTRDLRWDTWVIEPEYFSLGFCSGKCTENPNTDSLKVEGEYMTNHSLMISYYRANVHLSDPSIPPPATCTPMRLLPISMLMYGNDNAVEIKHVKQMQADKCGCV